MKKSSVFLLALVLALTSFTAGMEYQRGDVTQDGSVDIDDVTCLISYILNGSWPEDTVPVIDPITPQTEVVTVNGVSFTMVTIEGGAFMMGSTAEQGNDVEFNETPSHQVTLTSYSIGQTEVTQALWNAVMGSNPSSFTGDANRPVEQVSWDDCQEFISRLNQLTGKNFRLPTEAEWEYAARGGNNSKGYKFAGGNDINAVAWYWDEGNAISSTQPVATKAPNELQLYDMSGNVWEWCQDWFGDYTSAPQTNPTGATEGEEHVCRGGAWDHSAYMCRIPVRNPCPADFSDINLGLRLAL